MTIEAYRLSIDRFINDKNGRMMLTIPPTKSSFLRRLIHEYCESHDLNHESQVSHSAMKPVNVCEKCQSRRVVWDDWNWIWYCWDCRDKLGYHGAYNTHVVEIRPLFKKIVITKKNTQ